MDMKVHIESRNMWDIREVHDFHSVEEMMDAWWNNTFPISRDDEVLLIMRGDIVLYCSMGHAEKLNVAKAMSWFYI